jgi:hypothetical protein
MAAELNLRLAEIVSQDIPTPGGGETARRHSILAETAREDLSLAKLAEAHWDAISILTEAGRSPMAKKLYAVWASEIPGQAIHLERSADGYLISGSKPFCSGLGIVDRALLALGQPDGRLVEIDLREHPTCIEVNFDVWKTKAFRKTQTGSIAFKRLPVSDEFFIEAAGWYLARPGFWHGACGPAACWAGGVAGLVDFALASKRNDPHTTAHLGAMQAEVWAMYGLLKHAGEEIDAAPLDAKAAQIRALQLRHLIETMGTDILQRFSRAYGPHPLAMNEETALRYQEALLYMRQSHAERDLESLGNLTREHEASRSKDIAPAG